MMKKKIINCVMLLLCLKCFGDDAVQAQKVDAAAPVVSSASKKLKILGTFDVESEYVTLGAKAAQANFQPDLKLCYDWNESLASTVGAFMMLPLDRSASTGANFNNNKEIDFYGMLGYKNENLLPVAFTVTPIFLYYAYPNRVGTSPAINRTREFGVQLSVDTFLSPGVNVYYDFDLEQTRVEPNISKTFDLMEIQGMPLSLQCSALFGYLGAKSFNGNQRAGAAKYSNSYAYVAVNADLVLNLSDNAYVSIGGRYAGNNDGRNASRTTANGSIKNANFVWWGAKVGLSY